MSGVEILGLAASVIQVADTGLKLSIKLYTFTRKIKQADKKIDALAHEIATTGAILQQLGQTLSQQEIAQLCKPQAISTAKKLLDDCKTVFERLEKITQYDDVGKKNKISIKLRFTFTFRESEVEELRVNVERLKSSLLVILQVLGLAELLRNRETLPVVKDQRDLLETLIQESAANQKRYDELCRLIKSKEENETRQLNPFISTLAVVPSDESRSKDVAVNAALPRAIEWGLTLCIIYQVLTLTRQYEIPLGMRHHTSRIVDHGSLVTALLEEVDSQRYKIDHVHRMGLHNGILDIHWNAWSGMRKTYGHEVFLRLFSNFTNVTNHWIDQSLPVAKDDGGHSTPSSAYHSVGFARKFSMDDLPYELRRDLEKLAEQKSAPATAPAPPPAAPKESDEYKEWKREKEWQRGREYEKMKEKELESERQRQEEKARSKFAQWELEQERARKEKTRDTREERERWELEQERPWRGIARQQREERDKWELELDKMEREEKERARKAKEEKDNRRSEEKGEKAEEELLSRVPDDVTSQSSKTKRRKAKHRKGKKHKVPYPFTTVNEAVESRYFAPAGPTAPPPSALRFLSQDYEPQIEENEVVRLRSRSRSRGRVRHRSDHNALLIPSAISFSSIDERWDMEEKRACGEDERVPHSFAREKRNPRRGGVAKRKVTPRLQMAQPVSITPESRRRRRVREFEESNRVLEQAMRNLELENGDEKNDENVEAVIKPSSTTKTKERVVRHRTPPVPKATWQGPGLEDTAVPDFVTTDTGETVRWSAPDSWATRTDAKHDDDEIEKLLREFSTLSNGEIRGLYDEELLSWR